ncbi:hypothetical protein [aff. Roholtiella sp. LEGE 12411]|uniref:hypothetical protein n=1 Tax=aff. Roholtiella sp. LEGE 12411 TaxID=1828822 RepID=UPI001882E983|nr:hypothetical protein [aff. Roholtiella sp. LEGE 12411]
MTLLSYISLCIAGGREKFIELTLRTGYGALGIGYGALGMGHGALGIGHWALGTHLEDG